MPLMIELLAVIHALKIWRHYLLGSKFKLVTDHKSLKWIFTQQNLNMQQRRWIELLQEYDFDIVYRLGKENIVADSLRRKSYLGAISMLDDPILSKVRESAPRDTEYQKMLNLTRNGGRSDAEKALISNYLEDDGCLYYR